MIKIEPWVNTIISLFITIILIPLWRYVKSLRAEIVSLKENTVKAGERTTEFWEKAIRQIVREELENSRK